MAGPDQTITGHHWQLMMTLAVQRLTTTRTQQHPPARLNQLTACRPPRVVLRVHLHQTRTLTSCHATPRHTTSPPGTHTPHYFHSRGGYYSAEAPLLMKRVASMAWKKQLHANECSLCCDCGAQIRPKPTNRCIARILARNSISEGIPKQHTLHFGRGCKRHLEPPVTWVLAAFESKDLLKPCLKEMKGVNKVWLADAGFVCTEPHSQCLKESTVFGWWQHVLGFQAACSTS